MEFLENQTKEELIQIIYKLIEETGRAKIGEGTQTGKRLRSFNVNMQNFLTFFDEVRKEGRAIFDIYALRNEFGKRKIYRYDRRGKYVCASWDYHKLQATCSVLVGAGFLSMTDAKESGFDEETGDFVVKPRPQYYATSEQSKRFRDVMKRGNRIIPKNEKSYRLDANGKLL